MPKYDFVCGAGHEQIDVMAKYGDRPACPECGGSVEILWKSSFPNIHGDEIDYVDHNMASQSIRFTSKAERKRKMKELGLVEKVRHVGLQGGDRSPHTTRWV
jgi:putative FmdB family regulatory protein